jgi:3,4-dihydroxy 2-butanone 4-phosphate synthase / GTP cyclohydrolase II
MPNTRAKPQPLLVRLEASARVPTQYGDVRLCAYSNTGDDKEHLAIVKGTVAGLRGVLTRIHSECFTGDVLGSLRCDCGPQLDEAMRRISAAGIGVIVYLRQEGRGIGLAEKLKAYNLQDAGYDTVDANIMLGHQPDARTYDVAAAILRDLGVLSLRLLTNNPDKIENLRTLGVKVESREPLEVAANPENAGYLTTKAARMGHLLNGSPVRFRPAG